MFFYMLLGLVGVTYFIIDLAKDGKQNEDEFEEDEESIDNKKVENNDNNNNNINNNNNNNSVDDFNFMKKGHIIENNEKNIRVKKK